MNKHCDHSTEISRYESISHQEPRSFEHRCGGFSSNLNVRGRKGPLADGRLMVALRPVPVIGDSSSRQTVATCIWRSRFEFLRTPHELVAAL